MTNDLNSVTSDELQPDTVSGLAISLMFWLCLLLATALFATVALSPKLLKYLHLRNQFDTNQIKLVEMEKQTERFQKVIHAIQNDKNFAAEMTRIEFDAVRPDEEVIPVDPSLEMNLRSIAISGEQSSSQAVWYEPIVQFVVIDETIRTLLLGSAGILVVISFWILQPPGMKSSRRSEAEKRSVSRYFRHRYVRQS